MTPSNDPEELKAECKQRLTEVLDEYPIEIGMMALSEVLTDGLRSYHSWRLVEDE